MGKLCRLLGSLLYLFPLLSVPRRIQDSPGEESGNYTGAGQTAYELLQSFFFLQAFSSIQAFPVVQHFGSVQRKCGGFGADQA